MKHDFSFYVLVLIKGEFIGSVWVITCGNSLFSTPQTLTHGRVCKVHQHINTAVATLTDLPTNMGKGHASPSQ